MSALIVMERGRAIGTCPGGTTYTESYSWWNNKCCSSPGREDRIHCSVCKGRLEIKYVCSRHNTVQNQVGGGHALVLQSCGSCGGAGQVSVRCGSCAGTGNIENPATCKTCGGTKTVTKPRICGTCNGNKTITTPKTCTTCNGNKTVTKPKTCTTCSGHGTVTNPKTCTRCNGKGTTTSSHNCSHGYWGSHYRCGTHGNSVSQFH